MIEKVQRLRQQDKEELNKEITLEEMQVATQQLANNKTPGPDSIPVEVNKAHPKLVRLLHKTWLKEHDITGNMGQSNMVLIYKGKGDREEMTNYRPLQMLNTDYKIEQSQIRFTTDVISEHFLATSEVQQGCPLSPLIFDLGMEPLMIELCEKLSSIH